MPIYLHLTQMAKRAHQHHCVHSRTNVVGQTYALARCCCTGVARRVTRAHLRIANQGCGRYVLVANAKVEEMQIRVGRRRRCQHILADRAPAQRLCLPSAFKAQQRCCALDWSAWACSVSCVLADCATLQRRHVPSANGSPARSSGKFSTCTPPVDSAHASKWPCLAGKRQRQRQAEHGRGVHAAACLGVKLHTRHVPGRARVLQRCRGGTNCRRAAA